MSPSRGKDRSRVLSKWLRQFRMSSIQSIMTWSFSVFIVLTLTIVGLLLHEKFSQTAERSAFLSNRQMVEQASYNLEDYIRSLANLYHAIEDHMLKGEQWDDRQVMKQLDAIMSSRDDIVSIALFDEQGNLLSNQPAMPVQASANLTEQSWFHSAIRVPNHLSFSLPHIQNLYQGGYKWVVSMSKGMTVIRDGEPQYVILLVDINFKQIDQLSSRIQLGRKGYVYIIDEGAGNIVYHPQQQLIYMGLKKENVERALVTSSASYIDDSSGQERLYSVQSVGNIGWKIVGVSYLDEVMTSREEVSGYFIRVLLVVLIFVILVSMMLASTLTKPIRNMEKTMKAVERGVFNVELPVHGPFEVERLSRRFNLMLFKIRQLMGQIVVEQQSKQKYEFEALQAQINPHFLYNTLNSVIRMIGMSKNDEVITMITSLSKLFRISLSKGKTVITVKEELEHAHHYLKIQQMRFKQKFRFSIEAEEEALSCLTLKLLLQPIIENAIVHGMEYIADEGFIRVEAVIRDGMLQFIITDNGVGMSEDKRDRLLTEAAYEKSGAGSGVAVKNVHDRIRLFHGPPYGLKFESELEEGTTVHIQLPMMREEKGEEADEQTETNDS